LPVRPLSESAASMFQCGREPMIANAVFVATLVFLALGFWSMHELHFLIPWRSLILDRYIEKIALYCVLLFANLLGLAIWVERKFFLRDAGRKLKHLDQEIHTGKSELSAEILAQFGDGEVR
jgi:hypothetical protein